MSSDFNWLKWYWSVQDASPGTQVFSTAASGFVVLADATYQAWLLQDGGNLPTVIDTMANLLSAFNSSSKIWPRPPREAPIADLQNPCALYQDVNKAVSIALAPVGTPNSVPLCTPFFMSNATDDTIIVYLADGTTELTAIPSGLEVILFLVNNDVGNGIWLAFVLPRTDPSDPNNLTSAVPFSKLPSPLSSFTDLAHAQQTIRQGSVIIPPVAVDFNVANTDTPITISLPNGFTRWRLNQIMISGASSSLSTSNFGMFTSTGGGGTALVAAGTANTVTASAEDTNNNLFNFTPANVNSQSHNQTTIYFRVGTAQGSAATGKVTLVVSPVS